MPLFSQDFLQEVMSRNSIEDVISNYVSLKRSSGALKGLCPFHHEKTPSFTVSPDKQLYHCFGCGKGGTIINFIMDKEHLDFVETVKLLAERAGMDIPETTMPDGPTKEERSRILDVNKESALYFHKVLFHPEHKRYFDYMKNRGLTPEILRRFAVGFAPDTTELLEHLKSKGFTSEEILKAGITARGDNGIYQRFRNRIMFPIIDRRRNVIAFGGRVIDDSMPKYLNTSETIVFDKSRNLYGLNLAGKSKEDYLLLVEGYMDVIALHQNGVVSAVATLGTALTPQQARLLKRSREEVILSYDSDEAGVKATARAIEILTKEGLRVRVLTYHNAKDPDEFIKKFGVGAFKNLIDTSDLQIDYKIHKIREIYDITTADGKIGYTKALAVELAKLPSEVEREVYIAKCADEIGISVTAIQSEIDRIKNAASNRAHFNAPFNIDKIEISNSKGQAERLLLGIMLKDPSAISTVFEKITIEDFLEGDLRDIAQRLHDGECSSVLTIDPTLAEELSNIMFAYTNLDDIDAGVAELTNELLVSRRKNLLNKAMADGNLDLINEILTKEVGDH